MSDILVTGAAGFIGFHLSRRLLERGDRVVGLDNLNDYYDVQLKRARLAIIQAESNFAFHEADLCDRDAMARLIRLRAIRHGREPGSSSGSSIFTREPKRIREL